MAENKDSKIFQLKIVLLYSSPLIWRTVQVPSNISLLEFHEVIQFAMGWEDYHLHQFQIDGNNYVLPDEEMLPNDIDERDKYLNDLISQVGEKFLYEYDFGARWEHEITIEKLMISHTHIEYPIVIEGENACPPEDSGGIEVYNESRDAYLNQNHRRHNELLQWVGYYFDPNSYDSNFSNRHLKKRIKWYHDKN